MLSREWELSQQPWKPPCGKGHGRPRGKRLAPPGVEKTVSLNMLEAAGEFMEIELGLGKGLEFLQLWMRMESEKYYWVTTVLSSEMSPGQHGSHKESPWHLA